jgi:hypothetical protein
MNKLTTTLAGFALVAGASIAPAFAQGAPLVPTTGNYFNNVGFSFTEPTPTTFAITNIAAFFNSAATSTLTPGLLSLTGTELGTTSGYTNVNLTFTPTGSTKTSVETLDFITVATNPFTGSTVFSGGPDSVGNNITLNSGSPVPEASTVLSFGALLALGGLAVLRRKSAVQNAA